MDFLWVIVLAALGIAMIAKPELLWKIEHIFTVKNGEPTDLYITIMRIGGALFLLAAIGIGIYLVFAS